MNEIRQILVHLNDESLSRAALHLGAALAAELGAGVTALLAVTPVARGAYLSVEAASLARQLEEEHLAAQREAAGRVVTSVAALVGREVELREAEDDPVGALQAHSRTTDLLVVSQRGLDGSGGLSAGDAARLLVGAGCPLLIVPHIGWGLETAASAAPPVLERALVAWADRRESARALRDAMPLLRRSRSVELVSFAAEGDSDPVAARRALDAAAAHLGRHGMAPEVTVLHSREPSLGERLRRGWIPDVSVAEALLSHAADTHADYIVMGGYGHTRLWELVLGGVTRTMLGSMTVPVLMSH